MYTFKAWILWYVNYISVKIITSFKEAECVNIKEGILRETFHKSNAMQGGDQESHAMEVNKATTQT